MLKKILTGKGKISIIGIGYVGLPLAVAFAEKGIGVICFDINESKIQGFLNGYDATKEVGDERLQKITNIEFTSNPEDLKKAKIHIVAVPTPVLSNNMPNLRPLTGASTIVGKNLVKGSIVIYESTVYPGTTEETCIPILENESGMKCGVDFKVGYSPERINPGDKVYRVENIVKITSGMDEECAETIAQLYEQIIVAGVYRVTSIKVAEAAKVIENSQRDINIAFVNELSLIFDKMGIDTKEVLEAAKTKWNFLNFSPGLVGGHCIGVDPYYLAYKAKELGYHAEVILAGRRINDSMGKQIAEKTVKKLIAEGKKIKGSNVLIMGLTFKENCPDLRNSKVKDIILELKEYGVNVHVTDPIAHREQAMKEYGVKLEKLEDIKGMDGVIIAVAHNDYKKIKLEDLKKHFYINGNRPVLIDVKGIFDRVEVEKEYAAWRL